MRQEVDSRDKVMHSEMSDWLFLEKKMWWWWRWSRKGDNR